jgi:hypothetical protein
VAVVITQNELLDALTQANAAPTEARTVAELHELTKWPKDRIREAIGKLAMQDRISVHQVRRPQIDGTLRAVPAYAITPAPKRKVKP